MKFGGLKQFSCLCCGCRS